MNPNEPKILFYDIETTPIQAWVWRCGEQYVRHPQLVEGHSRYDVICISYEWLHTREGRKTLDWGYEKQNSKRMIETFTKVCSEADVIIGKNNGRFDDKQVNTLRMYHGLDGRPDLITKVDDLERQIRRYFYLPSYGLDYLSKELGLGGKMKMEFDDWVNIVTKHPKLGKAAFKKMITYCPKDVSDTKRIWLQCQKHFSPKYTRAMFTGEAVCIFCGSKKLRQDPQTIMQGQSHYYIYHCDKHKGYAGKRRLGQKKLGKMVR